MSGFPCCPIEAPCDEHRRRREDRKLREAGFTDPQVRDARAIVAAGTLHPVSGLPGVYVADSASHPGTRYICDQYACQCPDTSRRRCKHQCAVNLTEFWGEDGLAAAS